MMLPKSFTLSRDILEIDSKQGIARRMIHVPNGEDAKMFNHSCT